MKSTDVTKLQLIGVIIALSIHFGFGAQADSKETVSKIQIWGRDEEAVARLSNQAPKDLTNVLALACGYQFVMVLGEDGSVQVWGSESNRVSRVPSDLPKVKAIAAGYDHCVALTVGGKIVQWGNTNWAAGFEPQISAQSNIVSVSAGFEMTTALRQDGTVVGWWGAFLKHYRSSMPDGLTNVTGIASGFGHVLALKRNGVVVAWGLGTQDWGGGGWQAGQCIVPLSASNVVAVAAGGLNSAAFSADGRVWVWGNSEVGQTAIPERLSDVTAIAFGGLHTIALRKDGTFVECGIVGKRQFSPTLRDVRLVGAGHLFSIAIRNN